MNRTVIVVVVLASLFLGATAVSTAGDQSVALGFATESPAVESGETVDIAVVASTDGGPGGVGIDESTVRLEYPGEYLDIVALETGPYLESDDASLETAARVNNTAGVAELEQDLPGTREGVTGTGVIATITVSVAADAPSSVATMEMGNSAFRFVGSEISGPSYGSGELLIDGGGEAISPSVPADFEFTSGDELALGGDSDADTSGTADGGETGTVDDEDLDDNATSTGRNGDTDGFGMGFGFVASVIALALLTILAQTQRTENH